jgi:hypothetical protein
MKVIPLFLSLSLLLCGCYTEAALTAEECAPDDSKVFFYLHDGSYIKSYSKQHHRIDAGYQVTGTRVIKFKFSEKFDGVIQDSDIERIGAEEFNLWGTVALVGGVALLVAAAIAVGESFPGMGSLDW